MKHEIHNLAGYLEGTLPEAARSRVERHLEGCARCRAALGDMRAAGRALKGLAEAAPQPAYDPELWRRVRAQIAPAPRRAPLRPRWALATGGMALVAGAAALTLVLSHPEDPLQLGKPGASNVPSATVPALPRAGGPKQRKAADRRTSPSPQPLGSRPASIPPAPPLVVPSRGPAAPQSVAVRPDGSLAGRSITALSDRNEARPLAERPSAGHTRPAASGPGEAGSGYFGGGARGAERTDSGAAPIALGNGAPVAGAPAGWEFDRSRTTAAVPEAPGATPALGIGVARPSGGAVSGGVASADRALTPVATAAPKAAAPLTRDTSALKTTTAEPGPEIVSNEPPDARVVRMGRPTSDSLSSRPKAAVDTGMARLRVAPTQKALLAKGELANGNGDVAAARTAFATVLQNSPIPSEARQAHIGLGDAALTANDNAVAVKEYKAAAEIAKDSDLLVKLGNAYERAGQPKEAREAFRQALILNASCEEAKTGLSRLADDNKDTKRR